MAMAERGACSAAVSLLFFQENFVQIGASLTLNTEFILDRFLVLI